MKYLNESFSNFVNEMAKMTPEEKKARRKARREAKKKGEKLPRLTKANKASQMTPEQLLKAVEDASPSYRIEWDHWGNTFHGETGDRGPRIDHGGGDDGDDWMDDYQQEEAFAGYMKKWKPKAQQMEKDLKKKGISAKVGAGWGEKGHIYLEVSIHQ